MEPSDRQTFADGTATTVSFDDAQRTFRQEDVLGHAILQPFDRYGRLVKEEEQGNESAQTSLLGEYAYHPVSGQLIEQRGRRN